MMFPRMPMAAGIRMMRPGSVWSVLLRPARARPAKRSPPELMRSAPKPALMPGASERQSAPKRAGRRRRRRSIGNSGVQTSLFFSSARRRRIRIAVPSSEVAGAEGVGKRRWHTGDASGNEVRHSLVPFEHTPHPQRRRAACHGTKAFPDALTADDVDETGLVLEVD